MIRKQLLARILLAISLLITAFFAYDYIKRSLPITCEEILDPQLSRIPRSNVTATSIQKWFASQYGINQDQVFIIGGDPSSPPPKFGVRWQSENKWYEATIDTQSKQLKYIDIDWKTRKPQLSKVISCSGAPEYYTLRRWQPDPPFNLQLSLWYPQKGFIFTAWNGDIPSISEQVMIDKLRLLGPFDISDTEALSNTEYLLAGELGTGSIKQWSGLDNLITEDMLARK